MRIIETIEHETFESFYEVLMNKSGEPERPQVWRGQANAEWKLVSSVVRLAEKTPAGREGLHTLSGFQLSSFQSATRGRVDPKTLDSDGDWMALGQHYGLATPLLDWTHAPFIATFFAFAEDQNFAARAVYSLDVVWLTELNKHIRDSEDQLRLIWSETGQNERLIAQRGLFTFCPFPYVIEDWLEKQVVDCSDTIIRKHIIPGRERERVLRVLTRMNINYLTLFPDVMGAAMHANLKSQVQGYW